MAVRGTSLAAYQQMKQSGGINQQELDILSWMILSHVNDASRTEISEGTNIKINAVAGRVNSLIKKGLLGETQVRPCTYTKRNVHPVKLLNLQIS